MSSTSEDQLTRSRATLLLEVARLYWDEGLGQQEVARRLGYSRPTVSRMLTEARRVGIVTVTVAHPIERLMSLEEQLVERYGIKEARVCENEDALSPGTSVCRSAGELLLERCGPRSVIAVSNGRTVGAVVHLLPERTWSDSTTVAMLGSAGGLLHLEDGPEICRNLALKLGGRYRDLSLPLVFDSLATARAMRNEDQVATTLELAARSDVALTGIGAMGRAASPLLQRWMTPAVVSECESKGVVAHVCGHHLNRVGRHVHTEICDRTVCLDPARLTEIPLVIGVAFGQAKVRAIHAALLGGYVSALVTDESTAHGLLEVTDAPRAPHH